MIYSPLNGATGILPPPRRVTYVETPDGFELVAKVRQPISATILGVVLIALALAPEDPNAPVWIRLIVPIVVAALAMVVAGHISIRLNGNVLHVFTGVGRAGWNRSYPWSDFHTAEELHTGGKRGRLYVSLHGKKDVMFGKLLDGDSRIFVIEVLQHHLGNSPVSTDPIAHEPPSSLSLPKGVSYSEAPGEFEVIVNTRSLRGTVSMTILLAIGWVGHKYPWIVIVHGVIFGALTLMCLVGHVRVTLRDGMLRVFTGVGPIGWSHNINWNHVAAVKQAYGWGGDPSILIRGTRNFKFGGGLGRERRVFILHVLQYHLTARANGSVSS